MTTSQIKKISAVVALVSSLVGGGWFLDSRWVTTEVFAGTLEQFQERVDLRFLQQRQSDLFEHYIRLKEMKRLFDNSDQEINEEFELVKEQLRKVEEDISAILTGRPR